MSGHPPFSRFIAAGTRRVTAMVSLVWLNLAMLPCAMAMESDHSCPDCPPEAAQEVVSHHDHAVAEKGADCSFAQADCCQIDQINIDDRSQKSGKDDGKKIAVITNIGFGQFSAYSLTPEFPTGPPDPGPGTTRLHALFCVYLD